MPISFYESPFYPNWARERINFSMMVEGKKLWLVIKPYMRCPLLPPNFEFCFNCLCHGNLYLLLAKPKWRKIAIKCGGQVQQEQNATKKQLILNCHIVQQLLQLLYIGSCSFFAFISLTSKTFLEHVKIILNAF